MMRLVGALCASCGIYYDDGSSSNKKSGSKSVVTSQKDSSNDFTGPSKRGSSPGEGRSSPSGQVAQPARPAEDRSCRPCILSSIETVLGFVLTCVDYLFGIVYYPHVALRRCWKSLRRSFLTSDQIKTVVIVGGNFSGLSAAHELECYHDLNVILIDKREYYEYVPGILRLFCNPNLFRSLARPIPYGGFDFVLGTVTKVDDDHVDVLRPSGEVGQISFDYLILATGADYRQPITPGQGDVTLAQRAETWQREASKVKNADSVLVLGGGAVGTELAAEIACHYPRKRVTLIDGSSPLVKSFPHTTSMHVERWFEEKGICLIQDKRLERWTETSCTTKDGEVYEADVVYVCMGMKCNSQAVASGKLADSLGSRQEVKVNEYLQVEGRKNVFAAGDVMSHPSGELKQAYYAEMNGAAAAENVLRSVRGEHLLLYPDDIAGAPVMPLVYVVSLGRYDGSMGFNKIVLNGGVACLMKWFIEWTKVRQMAGQPIGIFIWTLADSITFFLSRTCVKPMAKGSD